MNNDLKLSMARLSASHLQKRYGKRTVVKDVSLELHSGEVVGLLGPNGAGKTTCFYMIVGLVGADGGEIAVDNTAITHLAIHKRARMGLSYLPQEASVFRKLTVEENVRAVLELTIDGSDRNVHPNGHDAANDLAAEQARDALVLLQAGHSAGADANGAAAPSGLPPGVSSNGAGGERNRRRPEGRANGRAASLRRTRVEDIEIELNRLLADLHIAHLRQAPALSLSGGERRRVEIARALATFPRFILLDEPFAGVDPIAVLEIQRIIRFLRDRSIGVLITDHNVRETLGICDRAYIINDGQVLAAGHPDEIVGNEAVRKVYLGENFKL
jgi:ABC-type lipopolysaccharide export system ATPase subunit